MSQNSLVSNCEPENPGTKVQKLCHCSCYFGAACYLLSSIGEAAFASFMMSRKKQQVREKNKVPQDEAITVELLDSIVLLNKQHL